MTRRNWRTFASAPVAVLAIMVGAGSAWGSDLTIHRRPNAGVVRPVGRVVQPAVSASRPLAANASQGGDISPDGGTPPILYGGGPVMHAVTTHVIAWSPSGSPFPSGYVSGYEQFLSDLRQGLGLSSNASSILAQYSDAGGSAMTSLTNDAPITDTDPYPTSGCFVSGTSTCLTEAQLVSEVSNQIASYGLNADINQSYIMLLPPGVDTCYDSSASECEDQTFCGYHTAFSIGNGGFTSFTLLPYTESYYSNAPYAGCSDGLGPSSVSTDVMALDGVGAHELFESATDPVPGLGYVDSTDNEVADECAWYYAPTNPATPGGLYNQVLNGNQYLIQDMWSNQAAACAQGAINTATAPVTAPTAVAPGSTASLSATLAHDSAGASSYSWSYRDPYGATNLDFASGPNAQVTLPSVGPYTVWVNITDAAGGTITGVANVAVADPPSPLFTWSPEHPTAKSNMSFTSAGIPGDGSITGYAWNFGDGSTSTEAAPSHVYATPGNYTVTLEVTQTDGLTGSVQHSITVAPQPPTAGWLGKELVPHGKGLHIAGLLAKNGTTITVAGATESGRLVVTWYATVKHHRIVVARGSKAVAAGAADQVVIRLTAAGRALLRRSRSLRITIVAIYTSASPKVTSTKTITLRH